MARTVETPKPKLKHLKLLKRMLEEQLGYTSASHIGGGNNYRLFHKSPIKGIQESFVWFRDEIPRANDVIHCFYKWGWVNRMTDVPEWKDGKDANNAFAWYETPYVATKQAREYWNETGKDLYEKLTKEAAATLAEVDRLVIIRAKSRDGIRRASGRNAGMLVRVVRETKSRLYVEHVASYNDGAWTHDYITGNGANQFIERDQVYMDGVEQTKFDKIVAVENIIAADKKAIADELHEQLQVIKDQFADRGLQQQAYYDDLMLEI
jgi:hypothetical protein